MSTGTHALSGADAVVGAAAKSEGFFQRWARRIVEGQERKARAMVNDYLAAQSDKNLAAMGYTPSEIKEIRTRATGNVAAWV